MAKGNDNQRYCLLRVIRTVRRNYEHPLDIGMVFGFRGTSGNVLRVMVGSQEIFIGGGGAHGKEEEMERAAEMAIEGPNFVWKKSAHLRSWGSLEKQTKSAEISIARYLAHRKKNASHSVNLSQHRSIKFDFESKRGSHSTLVHSLDFCCPMQQNGDCRGECCQCIFLSTPMVRRANLRVSGTGLKGMTSMLITLFPHSMLPKTKSSTVLHWIYWESGRTPQDIVLNFLLVLLRIW